METILVVALTIAVAVFLIWFTIILPYKMAGKRNRSRAVWLIVSLLISPIIAVVVLAALGPAEDKTHVADTFA